MSKTMKINGETFNCELVLTNDITRKGDSRSAVALFKVSMEDGSHTSYWTVFCRTFDANGEPVLCSDGEGEAPCGHVIAHSCEQRDGEMVQRSVTLAALVAENPVLNKVLELGPSGLRNLLKRGLKECEENLKAEGYDLDACTAKMDELKKQGKSEKEIMDYMMEHRTDFITKDKPDTKGDSAKNEEVW